MLAFLLCSGAAQRKCWSAREQAICKALREREAALLTVQALEEELEKKRRGVAALEEDGRAGFGGDKGKTRRAAGLNADKAALEARTRPAALPMRVSVPAPPVQGVGCWIFADFYPVGGPGCARSPCHPTLQMGVLTPVLLVQSVPGSSCVVAVSGELPCNARTAPASHGASAEF